MKSVLLVMLVMASHIGYGQLAIIEKQKPVNNDNTVKPVRVIPPGAYSLSPDNMPVVVPDMTRVKPIPNSIKRGDKMPFIPNLYQGKPIIVSQKNVTLQKNLSNKKPG